VLVISPPSLLKISTDRFGKVKACVGREGQQTSKVKKMFFVGQDD